MSSNDGLNPIPILNPNPILKDKEKEIYKEKEKSENGSQAPPPPPDFNLTKKEISCPNPDEVDGAWFEMVDQEQVKKWGAVKTTRTQTAKLVSKFKSPDVLIAAIRACPSNLDRHYDYLKKIANNPQSVEIYIKKAELEVEPPPLVAELKESIIKVTQDTTSS